jgi:recD like protein
MKFTLNENQEKVVQAAINHYNNSSEQTFQFVGEAGTGKSVVMNEIKKRLELKDDEVLAMAYTGQAASVMRSKGIHSAVTCHAGLFNFLQEPDIDPITGLQRIDPQFNIPMTKIKFNPIDFSKSNIKAIFIDEAWMVPESFKKYINNTGIKVFACGDPGQLPPVGDNPAYFTTGTVHRLTELMRQSENSPIVYLAHRARNNMKIEHGTYGNQVYVIYEDELSDKVMNMADIVLCGRRKTREFINNKIRHDIRNIISTTPIIGERLICKKNNWDVVVEGIAMTNGLIGTVVKPPNISTYDGKVFCIDFLPDLLSMPFINLPCDYNYLNASDDMKEAIKNSRFGIGIKMDYAYASTTHSSQGSEYSQGIYIEEFLNKDIQSALNYTGITRFKQRLIYVKKRPKYY